MICKQCKLIMTWAIQRKQYYRLINTLGYTDKQAKTIMPLCNKCVTKMINDSKRERLGMFISTPDDKCDGCDRGCPVSAKCSRVK